MAEDILHFGAIRYRVVGTGLLHSKMESLDGVRTQELATIEMQEATDIQPRVLANFKQQRALVEIYTEDFGDFMKINRVIYFVKGLWTEYPG